MAATGGSAAAQYILARMHKYGHGTEQSWTSAMEWYVKSAEQGYPLAQVALGEIYEYGTDGVDQSDDKAEGWYKKVNCSGWNKSCDIRAQVNLVLMQRRKDAARKYTVEDVRLFHKAADLPKWHDVRVLHELGAMYYYGHGIIRNMQTGMHWWQKAANKGHVESDYQLGCAHKKSNQMRFAVDHWTKAARQGHREAAYNLANWWAEQTSQKSSVSEAKKWRLKAAKLGHVDAQYQVAVLFEAGTHDFTQSTTIAHEWYKRAADQGHTLSQQKVSELSAGS